MGKGDIKTKRGKISKGTFGVTRPRPKSKNRGAVAAKPKAESKPATKKPAAKKTPANKKATTKKEDK